MVNRADVHAGQPFRPIDSNTLERARASSVTELPREIARVRPRSILHMRISLRFNLVSAGTSCYLGRIPLFTEVRQVIDIKEETFSSFLIKVVVITESKLIPKMFSNSSKSEPGINPSRTREKPCSDYWNYLSLDIRYFTGTICYLIDLKHPWKFLFWFPLIKLFDIKSKFIRASLYFD